MCQRNIEKNPNKQCDLNVCPMCDGGHMYRFQDLVRTDGTWGEIMEIACNKNEQNQDTRQIHLSFHRRQTFNM